MQVERECEACAWIQLGMRCEVYGLVINSTANNVWGFETYFNHKEGVRLGTELDHTCDVGLGLNSTGSELWDVWLNSITGLVNTSYSKESLQIVLTLILLQNSVCDYVTALCDSTVWQHYVTALCDSIVFQKQAWRQNVGLIKVTWLY
jgi:hypothetical protein